MQFKTKLLFLLSIAKQLSTGAAKLATLNGKQVLISTQPTVINQAQKLNAAPTMVSGGAGSNPVPAQTVMTTAATPIGKPFFSFIIEDMYSFWCFLIKSLFKTSKCKYVMTRNTRFAGIPRC